jgi:hypothetical protein
VLAGRGTECAKLDELLAAARSGRSSEADDIANATGTEPLAIGRLSLAGYRGIEAEAVAVFEATEPAAIARGGEGIVLTFAKLGISRREHLARVLGGD